MAITIPQKLSKHLKDDNSKWERRIGTLIEKLEPILDQTPVFFPQYTNHGLKHISTVLEMASELIPSKSLGKHALSSRDIACLIAAILIHDLGMFLTPDGMTTLMTPEWDQHRLSDLDQSSWSDAWDQYITSTKRLPASQKIRCFGKDLKVENTTLDKEKMVYDDKLVIGEFLRRYHSRLAYEIAVAGLPGSTLQKFLEISDFDKTDRRIIGLMARSHGMSLRKVEDHLGSNAHYSNLPIYYLMSVLRLADYLDASEDRAPMVRLNQEKLTSPLSQEEWALNQCFNIDSSRWYPETKNYTIGATPNSSSEFARLEKWLKDIQNELDQCWAILAEKYPNSKLKLSIHRIKCTMYEKLNYSNLAKSILPQEVKVTANPEIVKLMMEPLYGDEPTYGVRELLQNAVDACLERKAWEEKRGNPNYKGLVDIRIENNTFTITDNGIGMNEEVLLNYYLSAGSSYRSSDTWSAAYAPEGKSQVARTGKFGVGFLAAFLLGDSVEVHTQHREDEIGYYFIFNQQSTPMDVVREIHINPYATEVNDFTHTGTTITIKLKKSAIRGFNSNNQNYPWHNWYAFDEPKIRYFIDNTELQHKKISLARNPNNNRDWLPLPINCNIAEYEVYLWKPQITDTNPQFYFNGIRVYHGFPDNLDDYGLQVKAPHVSCIDNQNRLQVNLSRKYLKSIPNKDMLFQEVFRWHIARLMLTTWNDESICRKHCTSGFMLHSGVRGNVPFLLSPHGFMLNHASTLPSLGISEYTILYFDGTEVCSAISTAFNFLPPNVPVTIVASDIFEEKLTADYRSKNYYWDSPYLFLGSLLQGNNCLFRRQVVQYHLKSFHGSIWLREDIAESMSRRQRDSLGLTKFVTSTGFFITHHIHRPSDMPIIKNQFHPQVFPVAIHIIPDLKHSDFQKNSESLFVQTLHEVLTPAPNYPDQDLWIPFDMEERKKKFPNVFKELKPYIDHIQKYPIE